MLSFNFSKQIILLAASALIFLVNFGCSRAKETSSKISISIPSAMKSNNESLQNRSTGEVTQTESERLKHLIINVSGGALLTPIVFQWEGRDSQGSISPPESFDFKVPLSKEYLIQVMAAYEQPGSATSFNLFYGDLTKDIVNSDETARVDISPIASDQTIIGGNVSGRYLTEPDTGPTGDVTIKYLPPENKPAMIFSKSEIFNGWFSFMMFDGVELQYDVSDGTTLWGGPVSLASSQFTPPAASEITKLARISLPIRLRKEEQPEGGISWNEEDPVIMVYGWFGAASGSQSVCKPDVGTDFYSLASYQDPLPASGTPATASLSMVVSSTVPTKSYLSSGSSTEAIINYGTSNTTICDYNSVSSTEYVNKISLSSFQFDGHGNDGAAAFYPPFKKAAAYSGLNVTRYNSDSVKLSGSLLPGLYPGHIDRIVFFTRVSDVEFSSREDNFSCDEAAKVDSGFTRSKEISSFNSNSFNFTAEVSMTITDAEKPGTAIVACAAKYNAQNPAQGAVLKKTGLVVKNYQLKDTNSIMPARLAFVSPQGTPGSAALLNNMCSPIRIIAQDYLGNTMPLNNMLNFNLSSEDLDLKFYKDQSDCANTGPNINSTATMDPEDGDTLYVKRSATTTQNSSASISIPGISKTSLNIDFTNAPSLPDPANLGFLIQAKNPQNDDGCYPVYYESRYVSGTVAYPIVFNTANTFTLPTLTGLSFYNQTDYNCTGIGTLPTTLDFGGSNPVVQKFYFKYTGTASINLQNLHPVCTSNIGCEGYNNNTVNYLPFNEPAVPSSIQILMPNQFRKDTCVSVSVKLFDNQFNLVPAKLPFNFNMTATPTGAFYQDQAACETAIIPYLNLSFSVGDTSKHFYFKTTTSGGVTVAADVASGGPVLTPATTYVTAQ